MTASYEVMLKCTAYKTVYVVADTPEQAKDRAMNPACWLGSDEGDVENIVLQGSVKEEGL